MLVLEKYNYSLEKYEKLLDPFLTLYMYEELIRDVVQEARDTADEVFDKLAYALQIEKDEFAKKFQFMQ